MKYFTFLYSSKCEVPSSCSFNIKKTSFANESKQKGSKENIKKAAKLIGSSTCSVIIVGAGIKYNSSFKEVIKLAELCNVPIVTAAGHGDAIPAWQDHGQGGTEAIR